MPSANEKLMDSAIFRSLRQKGVEDRIALEVARVMRDEVLPNIARTLDRLPFNSLKGTDFRLIQLRNAIQNGMAWDQVTNPLTNAMRDLAVDEAGVTIAQLKSATPIDLAFITPGPDLLIAAVMEQPFNGVLMSEWFAKVGAKAQQDIYEAFRVGMIEGKSIPRMSADLLDRNYEAFTTNGIQRAVDNAQAVARTAANLVQNRARQTVYRANEDIVKGVEYIATLDDRTTFICMKLHGNVYPIGEGERPPQHWNCRSTTIPVLKSWRELGIDKDDITKQEQADMDGRVPKPKTFDAWLNTKPERVQNKLLGPVRAQMWREGRVADVSGFVDNNGGTIPLKDFGLNRAGNPLELEVK